MPNLRWHNRWLCGTMRSEHSDSHERLKMEDYEIFEVCPSCDVSFGIHTCKLLHTYSIYMILSQDVGAKTVINGRFDGGFRVNGIDVAGPVAVLPYFYAPWLIDDFDSITAESLIMFRLYNPKPGSALLKVSRGDSW